MFSTSSSSTPAVSSSNITFTITLSLLYFLDKDLDGDLDWDLDFDLFRLFLSVDPADGNLN